MTAEVEVNRWLEQARRNVCWMVHSLLVGCPHRGGYGGRSSAGDCEEGQMLRGWEKPVSAPQDSIEFLGYADARYLSVGGNG